MKKNLSFISLFSGAGFLDLGFELAGFQNLFVNEINKSFLSAYKFSREKMSIKKPKLHVLDNI